MMTGKAAATSTSPAILTAALAAATGAPASVSPPDASPATPLPAKPAGAFDAMLAALAPQATAPPATPTGVPLATDDSQDGQEPAPDADATDTDPAADNALLLALAGGAASPAIPRPLIYTAPAAPKPADAAIGRASFRPSAEPKAGDATTPGSDPPAAQQPSTAPTTPGSDLPAAQPSSTAPSGARATPLAPDVGIEAMFPGLAQRLTGSAAAVASVAAARRAPGRSPAAVDGGAAPAAPAAPTAPAPAPVTAGATPADPATKSREGAAPGADAVTLAAPAAPPPAHGRPADPATPQPTAAAAPADGVQQQLAVARDGAWLDRLARDIANAADSGSTLRFQLNPEHLGTLKVELSNRADGAAIRLTADSEAARSLLVDQQPRLLAEARAQGMRIADARIDLASPSFGAQADTSQQQRQQHAQNQPPLRAAWQPLAAKPLPAATDTAPAVSGERYA